MLCLGVRTASSRVSCLAVPGGSSERLREPHEKLRLLGAKELQTEQTYHAQAECGVCSEQSQEAGAGVKQQEVAAEHRMHRSGGGQRFLESKSTPAAR